MSSLPFASAQSNAGMSHHFWGLQQTWRVLVRSLAHWQRSQAECSGFSVLNHKLFANFPQQRMNTIWARFPWLPVSDVVDELDTNFRIFPDPLLDPDASKNKFNFPQTLGEVRRSQEKSVETVRIVIKYLDWLKMYFASIDSMAQSGQLLSNGKWNWATWLSFVPCDVLPIGQDVYVLHRCRDHSKYLISGAMFCCVYFLQQSTRIQRNKIDTAKNPQWLCVCPTLANR
jgi:hypothetical protein